MKRILAFILTLSLLLSVPVFAQNGAQTVLESIKPRIGDTTDYEVFYSSDYTSDGKTVYSFNWEDNDSELFRSMYVSVTESGIVTEFNAYCQKETDRQEKPSLDRQPAQQVLAAAEAFLQKIDPQIAAAIAVTPRSDAMSLWSSEYRFRLQRMENGIPVHGDEGSLTVAADGKTVTNFRIRYTEGLTFSDPSAAISRDAAEKAYAEKLGMELQYRSRYEDGKKTVYAAYVPKVQSGTYIDAFTGEAVTPAVIPGGSSDKLFGSMNDTTTEESGAAAGAPMSPAEQQEMENIAGLMTKDAAMDLLRSNAVLHMDDSMVMVSAGLEKQYRTENYIYSFRFKSPTQTVSVIVDAKTGQIWSFNRYGELTGKEITEEAAKAKAQDAVKALAGEYLQDYRLNEDGFSYTRYVNGVPFYEDTASAEVDRKTGTLTWFHLNRSDVEFPSVEGVLTPAQAAEKMFRQADYELRYVRDCSSEDAKAFDKATLVYMLTTHVGELDPFTGSMKVTQTQELSAYTDIAGHYGETAIETLRKFGIGFAGGKFLPDATITQGEFLQLLQVIFFGMDKVVLSENTDHSGAVRNAVREGIAEEDVNVSAALTREAAAVMLVKAMGYDTVASLKDIYNCPFADVTAYVGHVSILGAMGVFKGDGKGNFLPAKLLTRADAALVLYNYLQA